jgi:hypothetical protein
MLKKSFKLILTAGIFTMLFIFSGCDNEDPEIENVPELITKTTLRFTPVGGGASITATATDPDGDGVQDIRVDGPINLLKGVQYTLTLELINSLYQPGTAGYNLTEEIEEEGYEHQFFFSFSEGVFTSPSGTGNIKSNSSSVAGTINYSDKDKNDRPLGLITSWTTAGQAATGKSFRVVLKHQPDIKSATSSSLDGETDLDITFVLNVN